MITTEDEFREYVRNTTFKERLEHPSIISIPPERSYKIDNLGSKVYLKSWRWQLLRKLVKRRCNNICEVCHEAEVEIVHHKTYDNLGREPLSDLMGVCQKCHEKLHRKYIKGIPW